MATELPARLILPPEAEWGPEFDPAQATEAHLATFPAAERATSDAYFEGGYWIALWSVVITVAVLGLLLVTRFSARLRDAAERRTQRSFLQSWLYALGFWFVLSLLMLPWTLYTGYYREHAYAMSNQSLFPGRVAEFLRRVEERDLASLARQQDGSGAPIADARRARSSARHDRDFPLEAHFRHVRFLLPSFLLGSKTARAGGNEQARLRQVTPPPWPGPSQAVPRGARRAKGGQSRQPAWRHRNRR
jgi:hypothetical protein